jgi:hypothetical protein
MEILDNIPVNLELGEIRKRLHIEQRGDWWNQVQALVEDAQSFISARAVYKVCYIEEKLEHGIMIDEISLTSKVLRRNLDKAERVFPYVITLGGDLEQRIKSMKELLSQYFLDTIGNVALATARRYLKNHLKSRYALDGMSFMSPGSLQDWAMEEQRPLFSILGDVETSIGVRLNENFLMIPTKSLSGVYFPTEIPFYSCQLCARKDCQSRKVAYDVTLVNEYGILK